MILVLVLFEFLEFLKFQGVKQVLVKLGDKGSALFVEGEKPIQQPAILAKTVVDTTGAGDTFTASFAVAFVEGKSKKECLGFAGLYGRMLFFFHSRILSLEKCALLLCSATAAAACLCVQVKGASPSMPDRKSVLDLLNCQ